MNSIGRYLPLYSCTAALFLALAMFITESYRVCQNSISSSRKVFNTGVGYGALQMLHIKFAKCANRLKVANAKNRPVDH